MRVLLRRHPEQEYGWAVDETRSPRGRAAPAAQSRDGDDPLADLDAMIDELTANLRELVRELDFTARELATLHEVRRDTLAGGADRDPADAWRRALAAHVRAAETRDGATAASDGSGPPARRPGRAAPDSPES